MERGKETKGEKETEIVRMRETGRETVQKTVKNSESQADRTVRDTDIWGRAWQRGPERQEGAERERRHL